MRYILTVLVGIALSVAAAVGAETGPSRQLAPLDEIIGSLPTCEWEQVAKAENALDALIARTHGDAAARSVLESRLVAALRPDTTQAGVQVICKNLATIGSAKCVPALAKFLENERLSHLARYALQRIPDPAAAAALHDALLQTSGKTQAGIISSIAARQDAKAVDALILLLDDRDYGVAGAALLALAETGSPKAMDAVTAFQPRAPKVLRDQAKDACLRAAERLLQAGQPEAAAMEYQRLKADPAESIRAACLRGLVAARPDAAPGLLVEALSGQSGILRGTAAEIIHDASDTQAANYAELISRLPPLGQAALLDGLRERGGSAICIAAREGLRSSDPQVQLAAIRVLGPAGTAADVAVLASLAALAKDGPLREAAWINLCRLRDKDVDGAMVGLLEGSSSELQVALVRSLAARQSRRATAALLKLAEHAEPGVRIEAYKAIEALADERAVPELLKLVIRAKPPEESEEAIRALAAACAKIADPQQRAAPLLEASRGADLFARCALLRAMGYLGGDKSLRAIHAAREDTEAEIRAVALSALANWPDATVVPELLDIARKVGNTPQRVEALHGLARVAPRPGQMPPQRAFIVLKEAMELAGGADDRRLILSRMAPLRVPDCLAYVLSYLEDDSLRGEALLTAAKLAEGMKESHPKQARPALERVLHLTKDERLRKHIEKLLWNMKEKGN